MPVDVAVVGCGPVGCALAALLGRRGHHVVALERHERPYPLPRAVHFDHEVGRILQACGLGEELPRISEPADGYEWRNGSGDVLLRFGGRPIGPSGWPDMNMVWQPALEQGLERSATVQPSVELRRGVRVTGLVEHADHVTLDLTTAAGDRSTLDARHVVGCDGANSTVRDLIGSGVTDLGYFYDWLIVDLQLHRPRRFDPVNLQICDPVRPTTAVSGGPGRRRWEFMRLPHETVEQLDDEATAWSLLEPWDVTPETATLERHAVYRFHARWADRWRVGRTLLAGDAAHQMPPFAGQGMCSGLRDAANLAWKLDLVLRGLSPDTLLDAYEVEREANVRAVIRFSMDLGKVICVSDPDEAAERDAMMLAGSDGSATPVPPLPGIDRGVVRAGWHLVTSGPEARAAVPTEALAWLAERGGRAIAPDELGDVDGTYAAWFAAHDVVAVLQRPDLHVFGTAATTTDVGALLDAARHALSDPLSLLAPSTGGAL